MGEPRPVPTYPDLAGKVALVTGGSRGIGAATCRMLAANGVRVAVSARSQDGVDALVAELEAAGADAVGISADAVDREQVDGLVASTERELGPIDILLPYAGGFDRLAPIEEVTDDYWREVLEANLTSTFLAVSAVLPSMTERGSGAIVTMASNAGRLLDMTLTAPYAAAKAGVVQFTRHVAMEVGRHGIRINAIAPATVSSERVQRIMDDEKRTRIAEMSPLGTLGTPEDCALATLFLVSDSASWLTGVTLDIAGGRIMLLILPARQGRAYRLSQGESIKVVNSHGSQVVDAWALVPADLREHMSMPHTRATLESLRVAVGDHLYSERRRPILTLVEDTSPGVHDMLFPACDRARYELLGHAGHHDNCRENFHVALAELGLARPAVPSPLNLFMNVSSEGGVLERLPSVSRAGDHVVLRAERDVLLSACPQDLVPINGPELEPRDVGVEVAQ